MAIETAHGDRERRAANNQALFREINERVNEFNQTPELWLTLSDWICECANETCTKRIEMTPEDYQRLREDPTHFAVAPSMEHVLPDVESLVETHLRYWVVEKVGEAAAVAEQLDPR
jgi:hypothetical protein